MGAQGDVMQCRWGMHGDVETIALAPQSVQEMYDLTVEAFNLSEAYRTPVFLLGDANIGHLYERLTIPKEEELTLVDRKRPKLPPSEYLPYGADESLVPPMASFGDGYRFYSTGLTHNEKGYPDMSVETQDKLVRRLCDKIRRNTDKITKTEALMTDDCEVLVVAYGITARSAATAVKQARDRGFKAGLLRLVSLWPFPDKLIEKTAEDAKAVIVAEMNYGQLVREVERAVKPKPVHVLPKLGENPHTPGEILEAIRRVYA
jgi:2-oxoglutarate ferredoxin oxidoreductase subunit alpha